jgi:hypothetical protein
LSSHRIFWYIGPEMANTWISDMQHFVGIDDPSLDVPAPARKMGEYSQLIVSGAPQIMPMFEMLVDRKKRYFAADERAIGDHKVYRAPDGELRVTAEARIPNPSRIVH